MKLLFGSLALLGLLLVQGQLIIWFALVAVQIKSMALQARVLGYAFGTTIEEQKLAHKMNTIHIESKLMSNKRGWCDTDKLN